MAGQEQYQRRSNTQGQQTGQDEEQSRSAPPRAAEIPASDVADPAESKKKSSFKLGEAVVTLGKTGEHNLTFEWIDVWLANNLSARFNIRTAPGNVLEVLIEQAAYRKTYTAAASISTPPLPVAPIGTPGRIFIRDTTTGETLERPWRWHLIGGGRDDPGLWQQIKNLIWKSGG